MSFFRSAAFPDMALIRQNIESRPIDDLNLALDRAFHSMAGNNVLKAGQTLAIGVGSRKISSIDLVADRCASFFSEMGLKPFFVPAMGSHGGATPEGQTRVLETLGIPRKGSTALVDASMEVEAVGELKDNSPVYFSRAAMDADHLVVINRIKPHTKFSLPIQSGLCKMLSIGLGKQKGAAELHKAGVRMGFSVIEEAARVILDKHPVLFGLALVEDGRGRLSIVEAVESQNLMAREKELLKTAESMMARIPFEKLDVLIVDKMGKDISGIGMDSNVTGRHRDLSGDFFRPPNPGRIFVRDLSPGSEGNANGIGLADFTTSRLVRDMDPAKTFVNALTAISPEKAAVPIHFETDRESLEACLSTTGLKDPSLSRLVRIIHTGSLGLFLASRALAKEIEGNSNLKQLTSFKPMEFDSRGNLKAFDEIAG